jgi:hypothetical protein
MMVPSGRRLKFVVKLQAFMPLWRPFGSGEVSSRLIVPIGSVPGDGEVDCTATQMCEKEGASIDFFLCVSFEVIYEICKGLFVISCFSEAHSAKCASTTVNQ